MTDGEAEADECSGQVSEFVDAWQKAAEEVASNSDNGIPAASDRRGSPRSKYLTDITGRHVARETRRYRGDHRSANEL